MTGLFPAIDTNLQSRSPLLQHETYAARILSDEQARDNLIQNLSLTIDELVNDGLAMPGENTRIQPVFALELEPGAALFSVRDWPTLKAVSHRIYNSVRLRSFVGLNL